MGTKNNEVTNTFAQWVSKTHYNVTFDPTSNGTIASGNAVVDRYDGQMITSADVPTCKGKDHYVFKSWNPAFTDHAVTKHEKYTAVLEYIAATVHFNTGENGEKVNDIIVDRGSGISNVPKPRHKSGVFVGWCSDSGLQNPVDFNTWKMPAPAVETTFYAKWDLNAAKATVSFIVTGGTAKYPTVVKVLQKDGWADANGSATLTAEDIIVTASDGYDPNKLTWTPSTPTAGTVITGNITYNAVFEKLPFFNITTSLGSNLRFIQGSANMNQIQGGSTVTIEVGPASIIYGFGETKEEEDAWIRKITIDPQSGFTAQIKRQSHAAPSPVSFATGESVKLSDSLVITGKLQNNTSISIPDAIETPLTINFIDPGNGGTGVATLNPDTYRVDNSNIGRRIVTSRKVYRTKGTFVSDIFEQNADKTYVYPLDENGLIIGFQKVTGMTVLPLYEDIGIESDHNEKFSLDLRSHYGSDTLDIICDMLRLDYLFLSLYDAGKLTNSHEEYQQLVIGSRDRNRMSATIELSDVPKTIVFRTNFEQADTDDYHVSIVMNRSIASDPQAKTLKIHKNLFRYYRDSSLHTSTINTSYLDYGDHQLTLEFEDLVNFWRYQRNNYVEIYPSEIYQDKGIILKNITLNSAVQLVNEFKRLIKHAGYISRLFNLDDSFINRPSYSPKTTIEDALGNAEIDLSHVYDEAKNITNFSLPFKYNSFKMPDDLLKFNSKIRSLKGAFRFIDFKNASVPNIFQNKKISNLGYLFHCASNGVLKANSITLHVSKNMHETPFLGWCLRGIENYTLTESSSMIIEKDAINLTYDESLSATDLKNINFRLSGLFRGFNSNSSAKMINVVKDMSGLDMQFSVDNMMLSSYASDDKLLSFTLYSLNKLPTIKSINSSFAYALRLQMIPSQFFDRVDKDITSMYDLASDSAIDEIDDGLLDKFPKVTNINRAFSNVEVKHIPDWWNRYSNRITDSSGTFEDVISHNMFHVPVSWGGYESLGSYGLSMVEVSTNNEITITNGEMRLIVHVKIVDDRVINILKEDMLILDELLIVPKANNYGLVFTKEAPTFTESTKIVNYPVLITCTTEPPANTVIEYTFDWRKEHHDLSSIVP